MVCFFLIAMRCKPNVLAGRKVSIVVIVLRLNIYGERELPKFLASHHITSNSVLTLALTHSNILSSYVSV